MGANPRDLLVSDALLALHFHYEYRKGKTQEQHLGKILGQCQGPLRYRDVRQGKTSAGRGLAGVHFPNVLTWHADGGLSEREFYEPLGLDYSKPEHWAKLAGAAAVQYLWKAGVHRDVLAHLAYRLDRCVSHLMPKDFKNGWPLAGDPSWTK